MAAEPVPASPRNTPTMQSSSTPQQPTTSSQISSRHSSTPASRRASQIFPMSPPPLPLASPGGSIPSSVSHGHGFPPVSPGLSSHFPNVDASGVPMRHPRPLTAAELHLELEKEQEAVVNRLTRELSALRAHSASVASTASSNTSGVLLDATDHSGALTGPTHPTSSRRHRSSSSVSRNSAYAGIPLNASTAGIPHTHRYSVSSQTAGGAAATSDPSSGLQRTVSTVSTPRYEEVAHYRAELEEAKRENQRLRGRIRELERLISGAGTRDGQRGRGRQTNGSTRGENEEDEGDNGNGEARTPTEESVERLAGELGRAGL